MNKILFIRGAVPTDRDPSQIMFDNIEECDDVWTQLCYKMISSSDLGGEIWYQGGDRIVRYSNDFIERWVPDFKKVKNDFAPDVIFARGGFSFYDDILIRHPNAFKIYYGAGFRRIPGKNQFRDFDLILVDTPEQLEKAKRKLPSHNIHMLIKPAADNVFKPICREKKYDVIMVGNYNKGVDKGHDFAFPKLHGKFNVLIVGKIPRNIRNKFNKFTYKQWIPRKYMSECYAQSKVAIICCGTEDSCPRVIPEALACNCPILVLDRVNFWKDKYINSQTGIVSTKEKFLDNLTNMIKKYKSFSPNDFYKNNLSLSVSSKEILDTIMKCGGC